MIPVLVDGASMPRSSDLPDDLKILARRNALEISHDSFDADSGRLVSAIERALEKADDERKRREGAMTPTATNEVEAEAALMRADDSYEKKDYEKATQKWDSPSPGLVFVYYIHFVRPIARTICNVTSDSFFRSDRRRRSSGRGKAEGED